MSDKSWDVVSDQRCLLGECPVWDDIENEILWIDVINMQIHQCYEPANKLKTMLLDRIPGSIALTSKNNIVAALQGGFVLIERNTNQIRILSTTENELVENRFNDGKCDSQGRFWAGSMSTTGQRERGNLYTIDSDFTVKLRKEAVSVSNGLAWSLDSNILYYIDSPTSEVVAFKMDSKGNLAERKVIIQFEKSEGIPDGMTIDSEGMLWVALWGGAKVCRYNPQNGDLLQSVELPVSHVTACTFGGSNLQDLYITTAQYGLTESEKKNQPLAGSLFVCKNLGFTGVKAHRFTEN